MQAGESLVDTMTPMTFSWLAQMEASMVAPMASMVASMASMVAPMASMASMVAPMASMVASMASLASMVETLDWWKRMTAESISDGERADGWTHKIREGRVDGLTKKIVHERADGLTHKIREEPTVGWTLFVDVVQVVTWDRTKRRASLVDSMALMAWIASTLALTVTVMMATMEASMALSRSKEETTEKGDRAGPKGKCQNERRCHESTMALMVTSLDSMAASMASMASLASRASRASKALVVAAIVPLEWLNLMVAEPKRDDERAGGLTLRYEGVLTVALELASMVTEWTAPMTPLMTSMAPIASLDSMVASLVWLRLRTEPTTNGKRDDGLIQKICEERADELTHKIGEEGADELTLKNDGERVERLTHKIRDERADGLTHKSCEERADGLTLKIDGERVERRTHKIRGERADGLTHKICEERVDGLILKFDGVRVQRLTHNISEERGDGLTQRLVDDDGSESGGCRWTNTNTTSCLRRTQRKFESTSALDCVRCEKTWLRMAQVTPSTEFALRKWVESLTWVVTQSGVCSSFVEIENEVHDEECWRGWSDDGLGGVEWWRRWLRWRRWWWLRWLRWRRMVASMASMVGVDRRWWTGVFDTEGTDVEVPLCPQW